MRTKESTTGRRGKYRERKKDEKGKHIWEKRGIGREQREKRRTNIKEQRKRRNKEDEGENTEG